MFDRPVSLQVHQLTHMLDALLVEEVAEFDVLEAHFLQALYWSLGGALLDDGRARFDAQVKYLASLTTHRDDSKPAKPGVTCARGCELRGRCL